jgi:hypothetical protein
MCIAPDCGCDLWGLRLDAVAVLAARHGLVWWLRPLGHKNRAGNTRPAARRYVQQKM